MSLGLETSLKVLQQQVDVGQRRYSTAETILRQITQERDSAVSQLGVAFLTIEQLKLENETLRDANNGLKARLDQAGHSVEHNSRNFNADRVLSKKSLAPNAEGVQIKTSETNTQTSTSRNTDAPTSHAQDHKKTEKRQGKVSDYEKFDAVFDVSARKDTEELQEDELEASDEFVHDAAEKKAKSKSPVLPNHRMDNTRYDDVSHDLTYLSFLDVCFHSC